MKKALSYKLLFLFIACALCFALAFSFLTVKTAHAANVTVTQDNITNYFSGAESFNLDGTNLKATVKKEDGKHTVSFTNALIVDDLAIELNVPAEVSSFKVILTYDSYFVNGAENTDTHEFDKEIKNEFTFAQTGDLTVEISTDNNVVPIRVGSDNQVKTDIYYKIKGADKCSAKIDFDFTLKDDADIADIAFKSINQKKSDGDDYKQTFVLDGENKIANFAKPRAIINDLPILKVGGKLKVILGKQYKFSFTAYSVFGNVSSGSIYVVGDADKKIEVSPYNEKTVVFNNTADADNGLKLCYKDGDTEIVSETYDVLAAQDSGTNEDAPEYIPDDDDIYGQYRTLVENAAKKEYDVGDTKEEHSIRLGDTYNIPSLENLVTDNLYPYSDLTYTVYYRTPSNSSSTTSLKFTVSEVGDYKFYVVFKNPSGKEMDKDSFIKDDGSSEEDVFGDLAYAVFTFTIKDDAPISVEVPETQGAGYVNTKYVASGFEILSGSNVKYTLYYNADVNAKADAEGWVEVNTENGFTESEIETIAYDGKYTFTPIKVGAYKIKCEVSSGTSSSARYVDGETVISVREEPTVVKPDNHWFKNNLWSVIFLGVGTLSLIGIIVLLFIKPKEETETDETGEALNINDKN